MQTPPDEPGYPAYVGIPTYLHASLASTAAELGEMDADVAIIGAPVDMVVNRPGARFGPRAIRQAGYVGSPNDYLFHIGLDVYLSVDIDVLDPAFAPGTGTPEPGGLTTADLLRAVRLVAMTGRLVAMDVV